MMVFIAHLNMSKHTAVQRPKAQEREEEKKRNHSLKPLNIERLKWASFFRLCALYILRLSSMKVKLVRAIILWLCNIARYTVYTIYAVCAVYKVKAANIRAKKQIRCTRNERWKLNHENVVMFIGRKHHHITSKLNEQSCWCNMYMQRSVVECRLFRAIGVSVKRCVAIILR